MGEPLTEKQRELAALMSDISEDCYCAGWMSGLEHALWEMVSDKTAPRQYGMGDVPEEQIDRLRKLSDEVGGWIVWWDDTYEPNLPSRGWGERFVPMAEWLKMTAKESNND